MTHPSIQGLREAVEKALERVGAFDAPKRFATRSNRNLALAMLQAQAAYLTEHGVLLSGEGLVRDVIVFRHSQNCKYDAGFESTTEQDGCTCGSRMYRLVPVPQDGE